MQLEILADIYWNNELQSILLPKTGLQCYLIAVRLIKL